MHKYLSISIVILLMLANDCVKAEEVLKGVEGFNLPSTESVSVIVRFKQSLSSERLKQRSLIEESSEAKVKSQSLSGYKSHLIALAKFDENDPRVSKLREKLSASSTPRKVKHFNNPNIKAISVNQGELSELLLDKSLEIFPSRWHKPMLASSVPIVFPTQVGSGFSGSGQTVVLLDTGIASNHSFLAGKFETSSACFSNEGNPTGAGMPMTESLCLGGAASSVGGASGEACDIATFGCSHGTNMAGIIAGSNMASNGVAIGAKVYSIQVATKINDETLCGDESVTPCVAASTIDLISALEFVATTLRFELSVAAVNISLGTTEALQGQCDNDPIKVPIDNLVSARIPVVAASGNAPLGIAGNLNAMASPACVSTAIAVAATNDSDAPLMENNRSSVLDLFAPGFDISTSTLPANTFAVTGGTSAAAAHVSGAFAVLKEKNSSLSVNQLASALKTTGPLISQGLISKRRIDISQALNLVPIQSIDDSLCVPIRTASNKIALVCL